MNRKTREQKRLAAEGQVFVPKRKEPMPSPKVVPLKHKAKRAREELESWER